MSHSVRAPILPFHGMPSFYKDQGADYMKDFSLRYYRVVANQRRPIIWPSIRHLHVLCLQRKDSGLFFQEDIMKVHSRKAGSSCLHFALGALLHCPQLGRFQVPQCSTRNVMLEAPNYVFLSCFYFLIVYISLAFLSAVLWVALLLDPWLFHHWSMELHWWVILAVFL